MKIRHPVWAGQFYPGAPDMLQQEISSYFKLAPAVDLNGRIVGIMAPHAGYTFSGRTAAAAYKQIAHAHYRTVVVLAPSHSAFIEGVSAYQGDYYETPLGRIPVAKDDLNALVDAAENVHFGDAGHEPDGDRAEHSLEVQLPFLQTALQDFRLAPLVFHDYSWENCRRLGEALTQVFDADETLIVASTDLYHGHSYEQCLQSDQITLAAVEHESAIDFCYGANSEKYMACGAGPVTALKLVGERWGLAAPKVIAQTNSAQLSGTKGGYVVGYAAAILETKERDE